MLEGCDVSEYNGVIDWAALKASGRVQFAIIRATFGSVGVDKYFAANQQAARKVGISRGYYHFAGGGGVVSEVDHFVGTVGKLEPGETLWLDAEIPPAEHNVWCQAFVDALRPFVAVPGIYSNISGFKAIGHINGAIAWLAFPGPAPLPPAPGYSSAETLVNQTHTTVLPGMASAADIDYLLDDDIATFEAWGAGGVAPSPATPEEDDVLLYQQKNGTVSLLSGGKLVNLGSPADIAYLTGLGVKTMLEADITPAFAANILAATADPAPVVSTGVVTGTFTGNVQ